jgi:hypothetical protein
MHTKLQLETLREEPTSETRRRCDYLSPWNWALIKKPSVVQLLKNFEEFYWTRRFITVFTRVLHWSLSWARSIQSTVTHPITLRSILILSTYLRLGLPSSLFSSGFPNKILHLFLSSPFVLHALPISSSLIWPCDYNIKINIKEIGYEDVNWIWLA